jgi:hypothetical protein
MAHICGTLMRKNHPASASGKAEMKGLLLAACLALLSSGVHANENCHDTPLKFCSKTFQAYMKCNDADGLAQIHGIHCPAGQTCFYCPTGRNCPLIQPWEKVLIKIVGVEMIVTAGNITWAFAGNASVPDVMAKISKREGRVQQWFPTGLGFSMPPGYSRKQPHRSAYRVPDELVAKAQRAYAVHDLLRHAPA